MSFAMPDVGLGSLLWGGIFSPSDAVMGHTRSPPRALAPVAFHRVLGRNAPAPALCRDGEKEGP